MNGFKIMADSYRKLVEKGNLSEKEAEKEIRIYEFLAACDQDDFCSLVDSSAFNDIIKGYLRMSLKNAGIGDETETKVMNELRWLFSEKTAKEILENNE